jgi:hypothetical protein
MQQNSYAYFQHFLSFCGLYPQSLGLSLKGKGVGREETSLKEGSWQAEEDRCHYRTLSTELARENFSGGYTLGPLLKERERERKGGMGKERVGKGQGRGGDESGAEGGI